MSRSPTTDDAATGSRHLPGPSALQSLAERFRAPRRAPRRIGNLTYLIGFMNILGGLAHSWRDRLHNVSTWVPGALGDAAAAATVVAGILLVLLAHSLKRRKRRAWWVATVLMALSAAAHLLHGPWREPLAIVASILGLALLLAYRHEFYAQGDPTTRWRAAWTFVVLLLSSLVVGVLLIAVTRHAYVGGWPGLGAAIWYCLQGFVGISGSLTVKGPGDRTQDFLDATLLALGLMTCLVTAYLALRSPQRQATLSDEDDRRVREILQHHPDSLGYFTTRRDKQVIWSESGKSCIGYRVVNGVMLAAADPLGDPEAWPGAIKAFLHEADVHGWTPAVLACSRRGGATWARETGFQVLELGDEAIIRTADFSLEGRPMRNVRQMVNRVRRQGYETRMYRVRDAAPGERERAEADAAAWRGSGTERGFSMASGRVLDPVDADAVVITATKDGVVRGFLQFAPWGEDGMSLDIMRRDRESDPGVNDLLVVDALRRAPELGITTVSLNFAMFRSVLARGEQLGAGPIVTWSRSVLVFLSRWFQIESLYTFNDKFRPEWRPRFIVYPTTRSLVRVGVAMGEAEAFIVFPRLRWFGGQA